MHVLHTYQPLCIFDDAFDVGALVMTDFEERVLVGGLIALVKNLIREAHTDGSFTNHGEAELRRACVCTCVCDARTYVRLYMRVRCRCTERTSS